MMEALRIVSGSWPIAFMFVVSILGIVAFRIIAAIRQSSREDKLFKSEAARHVSNVPSIRSNNHNH